MRPSLTLTTLCGAIAATAQENTGLGYDCQPTCIASTVPANESSTLSFGQHYAVLNLDLINALVSGVANTPAGDAFISNTAKWIDAVHAQNPPPLSIFTRIYFANPRHPEVKPGSGFFEASAALQPGTANDTLTQLYPAFHVDAAAGDVVLQKARYYAGFGNSLEEILSSQSIDTVVLSGIRTSGVVLSTTYRLFDLNYNVYVIANNTIESSPDTPDINANILEGIIPKLPANVITIEQAIAALNKSGPAIY